MWIFNRIYQGKRDDVRRTTFHPLVFLASDDGIRAVQPYATWPGIPFSAFSMHRTQGETAAMNELADKRENSKKGASWELNPGPLACL